MPYTHNQRCYNLDRSFGIGFCDEEEVDFVVVEADGGVLDGLIAGTSLDSRSVASAASATTSTRGVRIEPVLSRKPVRIVLDDESPGFTGGGGCLGFIFAPENVAARRSDF